MILTRRFLLSLWLGLDSGQLLRPFTASAVKAVVAGREQGKSNKITSMGSGTCRCCNSTVNDAISRVHLHGHKLQDAPPSLSQPKRDAGRQFPVSGRYLGTEGRQVNHSGETTVQRQPGIHQPFFSLF